MEGGIVKTSKGKPLQLFINMIGCSMATHNTNEIHKMKIALCISGQPRVLKKVMNIITKTL